MGRMVQELSGIIACLQEIEVALTELEAQLDPSSLPLLESVREKVRTFFRSPTRASAQQVENIFEQSKVEAQRYPSARNFLETEITVDPSKTNMRSLYDELKELLEDV